jgi:hypothetical protein
MPVFKVGTGQTKLYIYDDATGRVVASASTSPSASDLAVIEADPVLKAAWHVITEHRESAGEPVSDATLHRYGVLPRQADQLARAFTYHPPQGDQARRYEALRAAAYQLALLYARHCPDSRELSIALTKLEEAAMWANAAIARNETIRNGFLVTTGQSQVDKAAPADPTKTGFTAVEQIGPYRAAADPGAATPPPAAKVASMWDSMSAGTAEAMLRAMPVKTVTQDAAQPGQCKAAVAGVKLGQFFDTAAASTAPMDAEDPYASLRALAESYRAEAQESFAQLIELQIRDALQDYVGDPITPELFRKMAQTIVDRWNHTARILPASVVASLDPDNPAKVIVTISEIVGKGSQ